ncbi:glucosaminidase domain-containing protein [Paenibacillus sp. GCM10027627]|uniref:glucosaminidase domain-containing protein n=1 Tax=unclassified Paenibacillus TaxID=185978 RepID=UPI00362DDB3B
MAVNSAYAQRMQSYAARAAAAVDMPVEVVLAQWALESGNGTSGHAKNHNNHGGIKYSKHSKTALQRSDSQFAGYRNLDDFVTDYIRVINLGYYDKVREATTIEGTVKALGESPYDAGGYLLNGVKGGKLFNLMGLTFGGKTPEKKPTTPPAAVCPACQRSVCPTCRKAL